MKETGCGSQCFWGVVKPTHSLHLPPGWLSKSLGSASGKQQSETRLQVGATGLASPLCSVPRLWPEPRWASALVGTGLPPQAQGQEVEETARG